MGKARLTPGLFLSLCIAIGACGGEQAALVLAGTTSTYDSGLLETLVRTYQNHNPGVEVRTLVAGSGEALELARRGDVDLIIVHAPEAEIRFVEAGHAVDRTPMMYNDFLIVGPPNDPASIRTAADPAEAFRRIANVGARFVSRGDSSGTHYRELAIWRDAGLAPTGERRGDWYIESGQGQGTSLQIASERQAYTLTDRATYVVLRRLLELESLVDEHESLLNLYSVILPEAALRKEEAAHFAKWLGSDAGRRVIASFRFPSDTTPLFYPLVLGSRLPIPGNH